MSAMFQVTLLVRDYDEAIEWFTMALGFQVRADEQRADDRRWVVVAGEEGAGLLLARASRPAERTQIGRQAGGRVGFFLHTEDFDRDYARMRDAGVEFLERPRKEPYGTVVKFRDLYGNKWDLISRAS